MKIILSPAKKMITNTDSITPDGLPEFIDKTTEIQKWLKSKSKEELKTIWKCNDKIAEQNFNRLENMDLYHLLTPAVLSYEGIAFQYMAPSVFEDSQFEYVQNHLRILSAFYGVLKPRDGVTPYRLEMQAKVGIGETTNLYEYWGDLFIAENSIENPEDIKGFKRLGYAFRPDLSSETEYIFERKIETKTRLK